MIKKGREYPRIRSAYAGPTGDFDLYCSIWLRSQFCSLAFLGAIPTTSRLVLLTRLINSYFPTLVRWLLFIVFETKMMDVESENTPRSACYRCHSQKLRCVQARGQNDCVRCSRVGAVCVTRPSKRVRQGKSTATRKERVSSEALSACNSSHGSKASASELASELSTHGKFKY
jgi:hypothetical protein